MKLKTALELIEGEWCTRAECEGEEWCRHEAELVARRAREEAFEMVANHCRIMVSVSGTREAAALTAIADDVTRWTKAAP